MYIKAQIRKHLAQRLGIPEVPFALERLAATGFQPTQIFDVGAYQGDFARCCLSTWPRAKVACFEALEHKVLQLKQLASQNLAIQVFPGLLGAEMLEKVPLHQSETASSVMVEHIPQHFPVAYHPMQTVDQVVQKYFDGRSPDLLKLDVQGYELEVLKGAEKSLPHIQVLLAEINLLDIHQNVPLLAEATVWLSDRGWVAYDICGLTRRPLDQALWQADFVFVPHNSSLRADKRWAA